MKNPAKALSNRSKHIISSFRKWLPFLVKKICGGRPVEVTVGNTTILLSYSTPLHYLIALQESKGDLEAHLLRLWNKQQALRAYDIGGYNGLYGLLYAKSHPNSEVVIFEPDRINAEHIERNIHLNRLSNCTCRRAAVSDKDGFVNFTQGGRSKEHIDFGTKEGDVPSVTLVSLPHAQLIKLDVEGAEGRVLSKLSYKPTIFLELHNDAMLGRYGDSEKSVMDLIRSNGLSVNLTEKRDAERHYILS